MKTLLSIDWDFFVPEDAKFDLGHSESLFFLDFIWQTRVNLIDKLQTNGEEIEFWSTLRPFITDVSSVYVSDSHAYAHSLLQVLRNIDHIILVDAHHDCWKADSLGIDKNIKQIYCHNWLRCWLKAKKTRRATWIVPSWSDGCFILPTDMTSQVKVVSSMNNWEPCKVDQVHVCRSGCWTPPWLDGKFIDFITESRMSPFKLQMNEWDPLVMRWSPDYLKKLQATKESS